MPADLLLLHQGVVPNVNLALAAGVAHAGTSASSASQPVLDGDFGSSVPGIAVAGDGAGIAGGTAAAERGRIAAIAAVRALRPDARLPDPQSVRQRLQREEMGRAFLDWLYRPADALPPARGRHDRLPLRGGDGRADPRHGAAWAARARTR